VVHGASGLQGKNPQDKSEERADAADIPLHWERINDALIASPAEHDLYKETWRTANLARDLPTGRNILGVKFKKL
jgi:hypothetical protein